VKRLVQLVLVSLYALVTWPTLAAGAPETPMSPVATTRPSHGRPQRSEDGRLGGAGRAQAEGRARNRVGIKNDALGNLAAATYADGKVDLRMPDAVGNLFRTPDRTDRKYGPAGQLLESRDARGVTAYEYDSEGNLTKKTEPDGAVWAYEWNGAGMLASVVRPNGHVVEFGYDPLARRTFKKYRGKTTRWIWDGNVPLHEWVERDADAVDEDFARKPSQDDAVAVAEKQLKAMLAGRPANGPPEQSAPASSLEAASAAGTVDEPVTWLFEPESFAPLAKIVGGERFGIVTDHLGTPRAMFDGDGREVWGADVDAYGDLRNLRGDRAACPFRWPGQYEDEETGLYYNRWRYYDVHAGCYATFDPIGLKGGSALRAYVADPLSWVDPCGLEPWEFDPAKDLDWQGGDKTFQDALDEAFERTGVPRDDFVPTAWAKTEHGKTMVVEWTAPGGAIVNVDDPTLIPTREGPQAPHVGYQSPGKRGRGGRVRGHILLPEVPATRGSLADKKAKGGKCG